MEPLAIFTTTTTTTTAATTTRVLRNVLPNDDLQKRPKHVAVVIYKVV
jgi:hypothetical protein